MCHVRGSAAAAPPPSSGWWHTLILYCTCHSSVISDDSITALILDAGIMLELAHSLVADLLVSSGRGGSI